MLAILEAVGDTLPVALDVPVEELALGTVPVALLPAELVAFPSSLNSMYISPVASLEKNSLPWLSQAKPTGLKQLPGHWLLSGLDTISMAPVVLLLALVGSPFANSTTEIL